MGRREPTQEQKDQAKAKREKFRGMARQIAGMSDADRQALASKLGGIVTVEGRALSLVNTLLIASQKPDATLVGGFRQWKRAGRMVRKGEHGAMIWVPCLPSDGEESAEEALADTKSADSPRFLVGYVFDVSQTDEVQS